MKYESKKLSNAHGNPVVYNLTVGIEELRLLRAIIASAIKYTPKTLETSSMHHRMSNFMKILKKIP